MKISFVPNHLLYTRDVDVDSRVLARISRYCYRSIRGRWADRHRRLFGLERQQDDTHQLRATVQELFELHIHRQVQRTVVLAHIPVRTVPAVFQLFFPAHRPITGQCKCTIIHNGPAALSPRYRFKVSHE